MHKYLFYERVPFMGVELLDLVHNYGIACYGRSPESDLLSYKWPVIAKEPDSPSIVANDEAVRQIVQDRAFIKKAGANICDSLALCFYMDQTIADAFQQAGLKMALPNYSTQYALGNKVNLARICAAARVPINESMVERSSGDIKKLFSRCGQTLGLPFIVQGPSGVSGEDTAIIYQTDELEHFCAKTNDKIRVSRFIPDLIPLSLHLCVSPSKTLIRGPFLQLVGIPQLSNNPFQFCGNDTGQSLLDPHLCASAVDIAQRLGRYVLNAGYLGILGVDLLWDLSRNKLYVQELNTRLVGLTRLLTGAQKDLGLRPDLLEHLSLFGAPQLTSKAKELKESSKHILDGEYSQVLVFNNGPASKIVRNVSPGIYQFDDDRLQFLAPNLFIERLSKNEVLLAYTAAKNECSLPGDLLARILLKRSVIRSDAYSLDSRTTRLLETIRSTFLAPGEP